MTYNLKQKNIGIKIFLYLIVFLLPIIIFIITDIIFAYFHANFAFNSQQPGYTFSQWFRYYSISYISYLIPFLIIGYPIYFISMIVFIIRKKRKLLTAVVISTAIAISIAITMGAYLKKSSAELSSLINKNNLAYARSSFVNNENSLLPQKVDEITTLEKINIVNDTLILNLTVHIPDNYYFTKEDQNALMYNIKSNCSLVKEQMSQYQISNLFYVYNNTNHATLFSFQIPLSSCHKM